MAITSTRIDGDTQKVRFSHVDEDGRPRPVEADRRPEPADRVVVEPIATPEDHSAAVDLYRKIEAADDAIARLRRNIAKAAENKKAKIESDDNDLFYYLLLLLI